MTPKLLQEDERLWPMQWHSPPSQLGPTPGRTSARPSAPQLTSPVFISTSRSHQHTECNVRHRFMSVCRFPVLGDGPVKQAEPEMFARKKYAEQKNHSSIVAWCLPATRTTDDITPSRICLGSHMGRIFVLQYPPEGWKWYIQSESKSEVRKPKR